MAVDGGLRVGEAGLGVGKGSGVGNECGTVGVMNQMYLLWVVAVGASK